MARGKSFNQQDALRSAMQLFWRNGYHATSMQQLVDTTGLSRSSLYETFGGKDALFLSAIELYLDEVNRVRVQAMLENPSPLAGIEGFFNSIVDFSVGDGKKLGCLLTNSAIEFATGNAEARKGDIENRIFGIFRAVEDRFTDTIKRGQALGEIADKRKPRELARFLVTQVQGVRVMSRVNPKRNWLRSAVNVALCTIRKNQRVA